MFIINASRHHNVKVADLKKKSDPWLLPKIINLRKK